MVKNDEEGLKDDSGEAYHCAPKEIPKVIYKTVRQVE